MVINARWVSPRALDELEIRMPCGRLFRLTWLPSGPVREEIKA